MTVSRDCPQIVNTDPPKLLAVSGTGVNWRIIKFVASAALGLAGTIVILSAFLTPYALTTMNGFFQLVIGAVMIWVAITLALAKGHHPSDTAVLVDDRPPTIEETARRETVNVTYALGSDVFPHGGNIPLGYSVHDSPHRGPPREDERDR